MVNGLPLTQTLDAENRRTDKIFSGNVINPNLNIDQENNPSAITADETLLNIANITAKKMANKLNFWKKFSLVYNPILVVTFAMLYWLIGLRHAEVI